MEPQLEKLEELVKDDDKIVTVISLSQIAKVSLQESQKLINKYVELHKESQEIHPTYILNGTKKNSGELSIVQVDDENIEEAKQLYETEPTVVIFSIQRAKSIDYNVISLVQTKGDDFLAGQIIGKNCVRRVLRKKVLPTLPVATIKGKSTIFTKQSKPEEKIKPEDTNDAKTKAPVKGTIANMFKGAQTKKPDAKNVEHKPIKTGGLSNFFTKQSSKDKVEETKQPKKEAEETKPTKKVEETKKEAGETKKLKKEADEIKPQIKDQKSDEVKSLSNKSSADLFDSDTEEEILKDLQMHEEKPKEVKPAKKPAAKKPSQKNKRKKPEESGSEKTAKRRKRIIVEESDSSDDMFACEKSDNEEPELMEIEAPEPVKEAPVPKNKRRKAVKKMYEDDEGFIVTETEYVYETASEDENVPEVKAKPLLEVKAKPLLEKKSNSEPEISPNKAGKTKKGAKKALAVNQPTLMNFFKKK